jgi:hypothetical protein
MIAEHYTEQELRAAFDALPEVTREILTATKTGETLRRIGQHHNLHIDQVALLNDVTTLVLCGLLPRDSFVKTLASEISISTEESERVVHDVNTEIFEPMRATLQQQTTDMEEPSLSEELLSEDTLPTREDILGEIEDPLPNTPVTVTTRTEELMQKDTLADTEISEREKPQETSIETTHLSIAHTPVTDVSIPPTLTPAPASDIPVPVQVVHTEKQETNDLPVPVPPKESLTEKRLTKEMKVPSEQTLVAPSASKPPIDPYRESVE